MVQDIDIYFLFKHQRQRAQRH